MRRLMAAMGVASAAVAGIAAVRHRSQATGRHVPGGILIGNPGAYDAWTHRLLLRSLFTPIAADIAAVAPPGARVLEVGCGPGHLAIRLAQEHGLDVTGLDLDPAMIERARINSARAAEVDGGPPFVVGDAASLPFPDESFDLVVSTMSMHHWADPRAGMGEIRRVLRAGGQALIWDFRPGWIPLHRHMPDPLDHAKAPGLRLAEVSPWQWPWRLKFLQRMTLVREDAAPSQPIEADERHTHDVAHSPPH